MDLRTAAVIIIAGKVEGVMARQAWRSNSKRVGATLIA
jgi:hypothetical protein